MSDVGRAAIRPGPSMVRRGLLAVLALAALTTVSAAPRDWPRDWQGPVASAAADLEPMLTRFFESAARYEQTFRNLTAEETRVIEEFDDSGRVKKRRVIVADLVVYRPTRDAAAGAAEFRDVRLVDGKPVSQRSKRALDLITRAMSRASLEEELRLIGRESHRYEFNWHIGNFAIHQLPRLESVLRDNFRFTRVGPAQVNGHNVVELEYREVMTRPNQSGIDGLYKRMGVTSFFERGRVWLDAATNELRRGRFEFAGVHPALPGPIQLLGIESTYVESRFGILVPDRIVAEFYRNQKSKSKPVFGLAARTTYTYGAFKQFGVSTDETIATPAGR